MPQPLRIGLAGLGTVGAGVVKMLQANGDAIAARAGRPVEIAAVSARSRHRDRGVDLSAYGWEDDPVALARRGDVDVVVEVMGGEDGPARATALAAIGSGKHFVTANKAMLARHGQALAEAAEAAGVALRFEAAVAGGVPVVKALTEGLAGNAITRLMGVLNGTCNYILTRMEAEDAPYAVVLEAAQRLGYAEADPAFDVGGTDAAQKLALLAAIAFGTRVDFDGISVEGIERVSLADIEHAAELGYRIRLLGVARMTEKGLEARMQPCLVPAASPPGQLQGVTNMVVIEGDFVGRIVMSGPGAGEGPTASAIVGDVIDIARGLVIPPFGRPAAEPRDAGTRRRRRGGGLLPALPGGRRAGRPGAGGRGARRRRDLDQPDAAGGARHRGGAGPDRHPPRRAGGAGPRARPPSPGSTSAARRRWRSASRRCDARGPSGDPPGPRCGSRRDAGDLCAPRAAPVSPPSRRSRPTPPRWRRGGPTCWPAGCRRSSRRTRGGCSAMPTPPPTALRSAYRFAVEDSIYLDPAATGRGIGGRLLAALIEASTAVGARQMLAVIGDSGNAASIAVHAKAGFAHVGQLPLGRLQVRPLGRHRDDAAGTRPRRRNAALRVRTPAGWAGTGSR